MIGGPFFGIESVKVCVGKSRQWNHTLKLPYSTQRTDI